MMVQSQLLVCVCTVQNVTIFELGVQYENSFMKNLVV